MKPIKMALLVLAQWPEGCGWLEMGKPGAQLCASMDAMA
jgi:hypothetical protein